jgi:hypothetical protein
MGPEVVPAPPRIFSRRSTGCSLNLRIIAFLQKRFQFTKIYRAGQRCVKRLSKPLRET